MHDTPPRNMNSILRKPGILAGLLFLFVTCSLVILLSWIGDGRYPPTGDEPHYLVMANGIAKHYTLEQTIPYMEEFETREIYKPGLAEAGAHPTPENTHAVKGPNGLYSVHGVGLPVLLAAPFALGGVLGARLFMVLVSIGLVAAAWDVSRFFFTSEKPRLLSLVSLIVALPFLIASNQIYPDIPAGLICLVALSHLLRQSCSGSSNHVDLIIGAATAFLPWLHLKFLAPALIIVCALVYGKCRERIRPTRAIALGLPLLLSVSLLAIYNMHAFGNVLGPYGGGALEVSKTSLMVLVGLHVDQNQGILLQNPVNLLGICFAAAFLMKWRHVAAVVLSTYLSLIIPNAMHPNWYGGGSFSGRFAWSAAVVFLIPSLFGMSQLHKLSKRAFLAIAVAGIVLQARFYAEYTFSALSNLYSRGPRTLIGSYPIFYGSLGRWLPAFYDVDWAFQYAPNLLFPALVVGLVALGYIERKRLVKPGATGIPRSIRVCVACASLFLFAGGFAPWPSESSTLVWSASSLPSRIGYANGERRIALANAHEAGFLTYGPYVHLTPGSYMLSIRYRSDGSPSDLVGTWDVYVPLSHTTLATGELWGTWYCFR